METSSFWFKLTDQERRAHLETSSELRNYEFEIVALGTVVFRLLMLQMAQDAVTVMRSGMRVCARKITCLFC